MNMRLKIETREFHSALQKLGKMPFIFEETINKFEGKLDKKVSEKDFSILEHICHLRDLENEGYLARIDKILKKTNPSLPDFDGDKIAIERKYQEQDALSALEKFKSFRQQSISFFESLTQEQLNRTGELEGVGKITLENLLCLMLQHDEAHLKELDELINQILN
jgi:hypothetical protein